MTQTGDDSIFAGIRADYTLRDIWTPTVVHYRRDVLLLRYYVTLLIVKHTSCIIEPASTAGVPIHEHTCGRCPRLHFKRFIVPQRQLRDLFNANSRCRLLKKVIL